MKEFFKKKNAKFLLEKTPKHVDYWRLIKKLYPQAYFVHMVRDPRSVISSMKAAGRSWDNHWNYSGIIELSKRWSKDASEARNLNNDQYFIKCKYEELIKDAPKRLLDIMHFIGIESDYNECVNIVNSTKLNNIQNRQNKLKSNPWNIANEPVNFFRHGSINKWQLELSNYQISLIEYIAKINMTYYNYTLTSVSNLPYIILYSYKILKKMEWYNNKIINTILKRIC